MATVNKRNCCTKLLPLCVVLATGLAPVSAASNDGQGAAEIEALNNYEAATAAGRHAEATRFILDYMESSEGENAPLTVALTRRYGNLLREEGNVREAVAVLKLALKRGVAAHGEHAVELFEIYLDLGEAYVERNIGVGKPKNYYDDALRILRKNGQHETVLYVSTLAKISSGLIRAGALEGALGFDNAGVHLSDSGGRGSETLISSGLSSVTYTYRSGYAVLEDYMQEAVELADALSIEDPYLSAKISIVQAKTKVLETLYLEVVTPNVRGSVSGSTVREKYQQEDDRLSSAINILQEDAELNQDYLDIANSARMDVAWLDEDMERMKDFCSSDALNMASRYPPDRLYEVESDGTVIAPRFAFRVSSNLFRKIKASRVEDWGPNRGTNTRKPQFVPVCIDGRLMAVLINSPKVSIEEID